MDLFRGWRWGMSALSQNNLPIPHPVMMINIPLWERWHEAKKMSSILSITTPLQAFIVYNRLFPSLRAIFFCVVEFPSVWVVGGIALPRINPLLCLSHLKTSEEKPFFSYQGGIQTPTIVSLSDDFETWVNIRRHTIADL